MAMRQLVGDLRRDLRHGVRVLIKSPGFTLVSATWTFHAPRKRF